MKNLVAVMLVLLLWGSASGELHTQHIEYKDGDVLLEGYLAYDDSVKGRRPGIMVVHEWWGLNRYIERRAEELARLGYAAFAVDMYGKGKRTSDPQSAGQLSGTYVKDRKLMRSRANAGLSVLMTRDIVDTGRVAAVGYCFGGTTALELARSGANLKGVVSFHGGLDTPNPDDAKNIKGSVLVLHGADDPFQSSEKVQAFQNEMRKAGADWQMNIYGSAKHSFSNPEADKVGIEGIAYNKKADVRSWEAMRSFLEEMFRAGEKR